MTGDGSQLSYDATSQQTRARYTGAGGCDIQQSYDGDRQRVKKVEGGQTTFYLRSTVLGGQVVGEYNQTGNFTRGYVYDGGGQLLAVQQGGTVWWVHTDPVTKSKRVTNRHGEFVSAVDVDPWGDETSRMENGGALSRKYTTYERDGNGRDQALHQSYHAWFSRFDQPDPFDGSYDLSNPQSFNRYAYVRRY